MNRLPQVRQKTNFWEVDFLWQNIVLRTKKIILEYLQGKGSYQELATKYAIDFTYIRHWVRNYDANGDNGLKRSRKQSNYTFEYKLHMVVLYSSNEVSYQELALSQGINIPSMIAKWVNDFRIAGTDALRPQKKGRKKSLDSKKQMKAVVRTTDESSANITTERIKQLEDELLKLRIENAYLKELRRLRLEEETLLKKQ